MNSYWIDSCKIIADKNELDKDINTDVCIIGGGITGISCAYYLAKNGFKTTILEKDLLAEKTSGNTTAKLTSQHGLFYKYLADTFSKDYAKLYLEANENAISNVKKIIDEENIECDFNFQDSYVFTQKESEVQKIKDEVSTLNNLNFPAEFLTNIPLPINNVLGAIKFPNQACFHVRKYLKGLCDSILKHDGQIYQNSKVFDVKKDSGQYVTYTKNNKVFSKYVVLATNYPIINAPGFYFLKMYQEQSYVIGVETSDELFDGLYINSETPTLSFRTANDKKLLIIAGFNNKVGKKAIDSDKFEELEKISKTLYPDSKVKYKWTTQDCISLDKIPYIGQFSELMPNMYVATGYKKWGMTSSNIAANIIYDKILGKDNKYEDIFLSTRFHPIKNKTEFSNMLKQTTNSLIIEKFKIPEETIENLSTDDGKIVEIDNHKVGIYKDKNNNIYQVKPVCSHLGCELSWNNLEKTWDCPCHGSRFDYMGHSIYSPSIKDLED